MFDIIREVKKGDYIYAVVPSHPKANKHGYVLMHRVVMENHLGRLLEPGEIIHHKDHNKHNNELSNLELMNSKEHNRMHSSTGRTMTTLICANCGKEFQREKRFVGEYRNQTNYFCSRKCNGEFQQKRNWNPKKTEQIQASIA